LPETGATILRLRQFIDRYELDDESAERARVRAMGILMERGVERPLAKQLADSWVRTGDYLFDATNIDADFVIGNPPYVRLEDIPEETAFLYREAYPTMRGRADLYVAFFEAALHQLKAGAPAHSFALIAGCVTSMVANFVRW
jgi:adenine-specific DNA-methyltransferase